MLFFNCQTFVYIFSVYKYGQKHNHHGAGGELGEECVAICTNHHAEYAAGKCGKQMAQFFIPDFEHNVIASPQKTSCINQQVQEDTHNSGFRPNLDIGGIIGDISGQSVAESSGFHSTQSETFAKWFVFQIFR